MRRSLLFMPGNNAGMLMNAGVLGADSVIFDLEDAVSLGEKDAARILVRYMLENIDYGSTEIIVRINSTDTVFWKKDLDAVTGCRPLVIMPPKINCTGDIAIIDEYLSQAEARHGIESGSIRIIPLIETAQGVRNIFEIAACGRVSGILLGGEDLTADLQCKRTPEGMELFESRSRVVLAARAASVEVYDTPFTDVNDDEGISADAKTAKSLGFNGKAAISPRHVPVINRVFSPTKEEIDYAKDVIRAIEEAKKQGKGVVSLRGKMIDAPVVGRAKKVLETAAASGGELYE